MQEETEAAIFAAETAYLESTSSAGNILRGFENYIKNSSTTANPSASTGGPSTSSSRRRPTISEGDRYFSRSSVSFTLANRENSPTGGGTGAQGGSAQSTPSNAAGGAGANTPTTPKGNAGGAGGGAGYKKGNKKKGAAADEEDEETDGKAPKRLKITYARDG